MPFGSHPESTAGPTVPTGERGGAEPSGTRARPEAEPTELETERLPHRFPRRPPHRAAVRTAWAVALVTDGLQWILWPLFAGGVVSPFNDVVDVVAAAILIRLLGWHWAFLPAFLAEVIPGVDLVPTWTAAVFLATRGARGPDRAA